MLGMLVLHKKEESMGETFGKLLILGLAGIYFITFNRIFRIYYFGFKGIAGTIIGCVVASFLTLSLIVDYWQWVFGIGILLFILWRLGKGKGEEQVATARDEK